MCELLICVYVCVNKSRWEVCVCGVGVVGGGACMLSHGSSLPSLKGSHTQEAPAQFV